MSSLQLYPGMSSTKNRMLNMFQEKFHSSHLSSYSSRLSYLVCRLSMKILSFCRSSNLFGKVSIHCLGNCRIHPCSRTVLTKSYHSNCTSNSYLHHFHKFYIEDYTLTLDTKITFAFDLNPIIEIPFNTAARRGCA